MLPQVFNKVNLIIGLLTFTLTYAIIWQSAFKLYLWFYLIEQKGEYL